MSRLVEFEDLALLDASDLRAVFTEESPATLARALTGVSLALRHYLLGMLPPLVAARIELTIQSAGPVSPEASHLAQREIVDTLCRLGRGGVIAFDDPYDMFPDSLVA